MSNLCARVNLRIDMSWLVNDDAKAGKKLQKVWITHLFEIVSSQWNYNKWSLHLVSFNVLFLIFGDASLDIIKLKFTAKQNHIVFTLSKLFVLLVYVLNIVQILLHVCLWNIINILKFAHNVFLESNGNFSVRKRMRLVGEKLSRFDAALFCI